MAGAYTLSAEELQTLASLFHARCYLYTLFHKAFGGEPNDALVQILSSSSTDEIAAVYSAESVTMEGFRNFLKGLRTHNREDLVDTLRDEYTYTFLGPKKLPALPFESAYRTGDPSDFQENTVLVREIYRSENLDLNTIAMVPYDHISTMCSFMALMAGKTVENMSVKAAEKTADAAAETTTETTDATAETTTKETAESASGMLQQDGLESVDTLIELLRKQQFFLRNHMLSWIPVYSRMLRSSPKASLYPQLAEALTEFIRLDEIFLGEAAYSLKDLTQNGTSVKTALRSMRSLIDKQITIKESLKEIDKLRLHNLEEHELIY